MYGRVLLQQIRDGEFSNIGLVEDTFIDIGEALGVGKNELRGLGHTTHQMEHAPEGAYFVWCNNETSYPRHLAKHLGRDDLTIKPASWLHEGFLRFQGRKQIVIDHAFEDQNPGPERANFNALCN